MEQNLLNIGHGGMIVADRIVSINPFGSSAMKRKRKEAKDKGFLIDTTHGRKTRSIIFMNNGD